ncbi:hypothetical protein Trydic_g23735 [Trypoxylus dichotomus]
MKEPSQKHHSNGSQLVLQGDNTDVALLDSSESNEPAEICKSCPNTSSSNFFTSTISIADKNRLGNSLLPLLFLGIHICQYGLKQ